MGSKPTYKPTTAPTDAPTNVPTNVRTDAPTDKPTDVPTNMPTDVPTSKPTYKIGKSCSGDANCAGLKRCEKKPSKCKCVKKKCRVRRVDCATKGWEHKWWKCKGNKKVCVPWYTKTFPKGTFVSKWGHCEHGNGNGKSN